MTVRFIIDVRIATRVIFESDPSLLPVLCKFSFVYFQVFSPLINSLLKHQSIIDGWVCLVGILQIAQPDYLWRVNSDVASLLICQIWHTEVFQLSNS